LFIGCDRYQARERDHIYQKLDGLDPVAILQTWGRDRCYLHNDVLEYFDFHWEQAEAGIIIS
jgi:hypothetical protein